MPLQNRVLPTAEITVSPARGAFTGNRGIIHRPDRTLGTARWSHHAWICCVLDGQGRKRVPMTGRNWTELFFLDEAVAMAAGHRPCGYCRRDDYRRFVAAWAVQNGQRPKAPQMDKVLHKARVIARTRAQLRHTAAIATLPTGAMILLDDQPHLVTRDALLPFAPGGYGPARRRPASGDTTVLTPAPMLDVLHGGFVPAVHLSAGLSDGTAP